MLHRSTHTCSCAISTLLALTLVALAPSPARAQDATRILEALQTGFVQIAESVKPTVVNIAVTQRPEHQKPERQRAERPRAPRGGPGDESASEQPEKPRTHHSLGSGVIIDPQGYILTNNHVVEDASTIEVRLGDNRKFPARVVGRDPKTDLAVIKIDAPGALPTAKLGDSAKLRPAQWVMAIGNPFGLDQTVTLGVVSAVGRTGMGIAQYEDFIQTDASINPGNSGGPLINLAGEVIGINTAITASGHGIGFAIPVAMAKEIAEQLIAKGKVVRGWLGIGIQELTEEMAQQFGVPADAGVLVGNVLPDGPGAKAGLQIGDVIQGVGGVKVTSSSQLQQEIANRPVGGKIPVTVLREARTETLTIVLGEQPVDLAQTIRPGTPTEFTLARQFGFAIQDLTDDLRSQLHLDKMAGGIVIAKVEDSSIAGEAGLQAGDLITQANRKPIQSTLDFRQALTQRKPDASLLLHVQRDGSGRFVILKPKP
jgi:Do/DeqQ family serine protease